jgi:error-prone DNA polymerase
LLSERHCRSDFDLIDAVARYRSGLIVLSDDEPSLVRWSGDSRDDLYVELTPGPSLHDAVALSRRTGIPPVATNRVRFIQAQDFLVHRLLRAIALNTTLSRLSPRDCCSPTHWLMPPSWLERQLPHMREALANTPRIAGACHTLSRVPEPSRRAGVRAAAQQDVRRGGLALRQPHPRDHGSHRTGAGGHPAEALCELFFGRR